MNIARRKAEEVYKKYGDNLEEILSREGIEVLEVSLKGRFKEIYFGDYIVIKDDLPVEEKRELIAHALGHHFLHAGNHLVFAQYIYSIDNYQERQANVFAAYLLIPDEKLQKILYPDVLTFELAEKFEVTSKFMEFRLKLAQDYTPSLLSVSWRIT
jgi:Zn-dependent peptidase ImmA (M78 family)